MNKRQTWMIGAAFVSLLIIIAGWFLVISPVRSKTTSTKADTATIQSENDVLQNQLNQLIAQDKNVTAKQAQLSNIAAEIPSDPQLPRLIRTLSASAADSGVDLTSLTPSTPTSAAPAAAVTLGTGTVSPGTRSASATYSTIGVALSVQGDYASLEEFLQRLQTMKRIFVVNQVSLNPGGTTGTTAAETPGGDPQTAHTLNATFTGAVFMTDASTTSINLPALTGTPATGAPAKP